MFKQKRTFLIFTALAMLIVWGSYYYAFGGRIVTWDGVPQLLQLNGTDNANDFQTYSATAIMGLILKFASILTNDLNRQILVYTTIQFIVMFVTSILVIWRLRVNGFNKISIFATLFYTLFPLFPFYAIAFDKSGYFLVGSQLFALGTIEILLHVSRNGQKLAKWVITAFAGGLLMILFRDDGAYILLATTAVLAILLKAKRQMLMLFAGFLLVFLIVTKIWYPNVPVQPANGGGAALSVPTQQIARIKNEHGRIDKTTETQLNSYLPMANLGGMYNENCADPVKFSYRYGANINTGKTKNVNQEIERIDKYFDEHPNGKFIQLWWKAISENKRIALMSFVKGVDAYFLPWGKVNDSSYLGQLYFGVSTEATRAGWTGMWGSRIPGLMIYGNTNSNLANKVKQIIFDLPTLFVFRHFIFATWVYTWAIFGTLLYVGIDMLKTKKYNFDRISLVVFSGVVLGVAMLSPIDGAMRYVMPIVSVLPLLFASSELGVHSNVLSAKDNQLS